MVESRQSGLMIVVLIFLLAVIGAVGWLIYTSLEEKPDPLVGQVRGKNYLIALPAAKRKTQMLFIWIGSHSKRYATLPIIITGT